MLVKIKHAALFAALLVASQVHAQPAATFPKPVRILVPMGVGGATDVIARLVAQSLSVRLGQNFFVENKPGANTIIGTDICARSSPDGSTLCFVTSSTVSINPFIYKKLPYNVATDFTSVSPLATPDMVVLASPKLGVNSLAELVAYFKKNPGKIAYGSFGIGSDTHVTMEWLKHNAGVDLLHVPYNGFGPLSQAFMAGDIQLMYVSVGNPGIVDNIKQGKMKPLVVFADERSKQLPDIPTIAEVATALKIQPFEGRVWFGIIAPKGTPPAMVDTLNREIRNSLKEPQLQEQLKTMAMRTSDLDPQQFQTFMTKDRDLWKSLVAETHIQLD